MNKKKIGFIGLSLFLLVITLASSSYAIFKLTISGQRNYKMTIGALDFEIQGETNAVGLNNAYPMEDSQGQTLIPYVFTLKNTGDINMYYKISIIEDEEQMAACTVDCNYISTSKLRYELKEDGMTVSGPAMLTQTLTTGFLAADGATKSFELRLWLKSDVTLEDANKRFFGKIKVEASQDDFNSSCNALAETIPNAPILTTGMIAVTYNETEKSWVKADSTKTDWYDYSNQIWANAVTVTESTRSNYMSLAVGEPISMDDINGMYVWIPRYSYSILQSYGRTGQKCSDLAEITVTSPENCRTVIYPEELKNNSLAVCQNLGSQMGTVVNTESECVDLLYTVGMPFGSFEEFTDYLIVNGAFEDTRVLDQTYPDNYLSGTATLPAAIDIKFLEVGEKDIGSGKSEKCIENWVTPEGFNFGGENLAGFWVGKFETGGEITAACTTESCTTADLKVKPNISPVVSQNLSSFFFASRSMQNSTNASKYGFDAIGTGTMDTHMMKNTEWGIVAYLSQSRYGKYGNPNYEGANKEIYQNKANPNITGMSNGTPSQTTVNTQVTYDTPDTGYGASTTGTIYGVYDMVGGVSEYVMAIKMDSSLAYHYNGNSTINYISSNHDVPAIPLVTEPTNKSGFSSDWYSNEINKKYYDSYAATEDYKIGDASIETTGWYGDYELKGSQLWYLRGGAYTNSTAGIFYLYVGAEGSADELYGFRLVLTP